MKAEVQLQFKELKRFLSKYKNGIYLSSKMTVSSEGDGEEREEINVVTWKPKHQLSLT